jgi:hypothetical protein
MPKDYRNLYESMCEAVRALEKENAELKQKCLVMEAQKKQWELEKITQQQIIQQSLNSSNTTNNRYLEEINQLRDEINRLKA